MAQQVKVLAAKSNKSSTPQTRMVERDNQPPEGVSSFLYQHAPWYKTPPSNTVLTK